MEMTCKIRFIPSFIKRLNEWDKRVSLKEFCPFCEIWGTSEKSIIPFFRFIKNDYPFMNNQFTVFGKKHLQFFDSFELSSAISLINTLPNCRSGGVQFLGSGASIPQHAHFSISDEVYPLTTLLREDLLYRENYKISRILGVPHLALVISGKIEEVGRIASDILLNIFNQKLSCNLLITSEKEVIIIPRVKEYSDILEVRKVGVSLVGGVYPCYIKSVDFQYHKNELLNDMFEHWKSVTAIQILDALAETTISSAVSEQEISKLIGLNITDGIK